MFKKRNNGVGVISPQKSIFVEQTFFVIIRFKVLLMLSGNDIDGFGY